MVGKHLSVRRGIAACAVLLWGASTWAAAHSLIVSGLGGEPKYAENFATLAESAAERARAAGAQVTLLTGAAATQTAIRAALRDLASGSADTDSVAVLLLGHGSYDGETYRFNVPGPDPTGADLAGWLADLRAGRQLVVLATSASGAAARELRRDGRTVITATKSGTERGATLFGDYWVEALAEGSADTDKDGRIAASEAYRFAEAAVRSHFESRGLLATEHPHLDGPESRIVLSHLAAARTLEPALATRRAAVEEAIERLRAGKETMDIEAYFGRLQELLLELALIQRELEDGS